MRFIEILCEGSSDIPVIREVFSRKFNLVEGQDYRVHPHRGKGKLPSSEHLLKAPAVWQGGLLDQLPIKLKNMGRQTAGEFEVAVVVLIDADDENCVSLKQSLLSLYKALPTKPVRCLFRIAVEETESWFIADTQAVRKAYPNADIQILQKHQPDAICGAWERLADALGIRPTECAGGEKSEWSKTISPYLNLDSPKSPSLNAFIQGVNRILNAPKATGRP